MYIQHITVQNCSLQTNFVASNKSFALYKIRKRYKVSDTVSCHMMSSGPRYYTKTIANFEVNVFNPS